MNEKMLCAEMSRRTAEKSFADRAVAAMSRIEQLTDRYNTQLDGKWRGMMNARPRKLPVFDKPVLSPLNPTSQPTHSYEIALDAVHYNRLVDRGGPRWVAVEGLG